MESGDWRIEYPSGAVLEVSGELRVGRLGDAGLTPGVIAPDGKVYMLDPRGLISHDGVMVYNPRNRSPQEFSPEMRRWLAEHPSWGRGGERG